MASAMTGNTMLAARERMKCPDTNKNNPTTMPITLIAPNFPTLATRSIYTQPQINAATAGRRIMPNPIKATELNSVATATSTKYKAVNTPIVMRSGMVRCLDLVDMPCCVMVSPFDCHGRPATNASRKHGKDNSFSSFSWKTIQSASR